MHSTAQRAPAASEIINETASTRDAWIRQRKQPMKPQKSSTKLLRRVTHVFDSAKSLRLQKLSTKLLPLVTNGFHSANSP